MRPSASEIARRLNPFRVLNAQKGIAMLIAIFALTLMIFIATEVSYDTTVEYIVASQQVQRIKAYYAAKAGIEISLLRIQLYKQAMATLGSTLGPQSSMLDLIWKFPLSWPPIVPPDAGATMVEKDQIQSSVSDSLMDAQYATTIEPETGKLNLNDLGSDVKAVSNVVRTELLRIFDNEMRNDDKFKKKYSSTNFEEVVNNIYDWITPGPTSANGGDKSSRYSNMDLKDTNREFIPPGRPFKTMDELHMVAGMKDDFYKLLEPRVTVYGTQGINVNYAPKEMLMALDPTFSEEAANAVIKRRSDPNQGGPFPQGEQCASTFLGFVTPYGVNTRAITASGTILLCDPEYNFRVTSTGIFQKTKREITVITFDLDNLPAKLAQLLNQQDQQNGVPGPWSSMPGGAPGAPGAPMQPGAPPPGAPQTTQQKMIPPKGRPVVVYWSET